MGPGGGDDRAGDEHPHREREHAHARGAASGRETTGGHPRRALGHRRAVVQHERDADERDRHEEVAHHGDDRELRLHDDAAEHGLEEDAADEHPRERGEVVATGHAATGTEHRGDHADADQAGEQPVQLLDGLVLVAHADELARLRSSASRDTRGPEPDSRTAAPVTMIVASSSSAIRVRRRYARGDRSGSRIARECTDRQPWPPDRVGRPFGPAVPVRR